MRPFKRLLNTLREGLKGIWKHKNLGIVSVTSTFFTLFIIGVIIIITVSINSMAVQVQGKVNDVEIFIKNDTSQLAIEDLRQKIEDYDTPKEVEYRSSEDALEIMRQSWGEDADLLDSLDYEGLLPASFVVKLENIEETDNFVEAMNQDNSVEEINYYRDLVDQIYRASNYVKIFGTALVAVLMIVSIFIISNTIRLTVISRINEIAIMKNVGATSNYIRIPFVIEGTFFGLLASILAYLAVFYLYSFIYTNFGTRIADNFSIVSLINPEQLRINLLEIFLALGVGIGVIGSIISIRRYLFIREVNYVK